MTALTIRLLISSCLCAAPSRVISGEEPCDNYTESELVPDDVLRKIMIENFKAQILWKLGMTAPPAVTKPVVPEFLMRQFILNGDHPPEDTDLKQGTHPSSDSAETHWNEVIILPNTSVCSIWEDKTPSWCFIIQFSEQDMQRTVKSADLWVYVTADPPQMNCSLAVSEELLDPHDNESILLASIENFNSTGWRTFDLSRVVQNWSQQRQRVHSLRLSCTNCDASPESLISAEDDKRPVLIVHFGPSETGIFSRKRRELLTCDNGCCKQSFYLNFSEVGWDNWIIAPQGYDASFCTGSCVGNADRIPYHSPTFMRHYVHAREYKNFLRSCCSATELEGIDVIYVSNENANDTKIYNRTLVDMKVKECKCVQSTTIRTVI